MPHRTLRPLQDAPVVRSTCRDVTFAEDLSQIRTGHGPANMAVLRNLALRDCCVTAELPCVMLWLRSAWQLDMKIIPAKVALCVQLQTRRG